MTIIQAYALGVATPVALVAALVVLVYVLEIVTDWRRERARVRAAASIAEHYRRPEAERIEASA